MRDKIINLGYSHLEVDELLKVSKNIEKDYKKLLKKYPIQYLIGYVNFYGYKIKVNKNVLIPRYETEFLVEKTINYSIKHFKEDKTLNILELGTGSGAISIALNKNIKSKITAIDISDEALNVASKNAKDNKCSIIFNKSDMLDNVNGKYDIIISNPPYISYTDQIMDSVKEYEPNIALFAEANGLYFYKKILKDIKKYINKKYIIALEIGMNQANEIKSVIKEYLPNSKVTVEKDLSSKDRYIFITNE